ncbi:hypothetical protein TNCV_4655411 [Trichonephila clavipes]|nr:hypothetical protein TNCV_4655411 [Trichonephila clavipes]
MAPRLPRAKGAVHITSGSPMSQLYCWEDNVLLQAVILAPGEGCVETSWKSAGGTDAGTAIGNAGVQMLVKLLELERLVELYHVSALVSLSGFSRFQSFFLR